jgi:hypothetical protein
MRASPPAAPSRTRQSVLKAVLSAEEGAPLFRQEAQDPRFVREWGQALRGPMQAALASSAKEQPEQLAAALTPALGIAFKQVARAAAQRAVTHASRWASGLANPKVWGWSARALWEGEPIWDYAQKKAGWFEVVELALYDSGSHRLLAHLGDAATGRPLDEFAFTQKVVPDLSQTPGSVELPVVVLVGGQCRLAARVAGTPPPTLGQQLQQLCFELDSMLIRQGSVTTQLQSMLSRAMERGMLSQGPFSAQGSPRLLVAAGLMLCLIGAALLCWMGLREYHWQSYLSALRSEPGIQVMNDERLWGRRTITGLMDPAARDPILLASQHGVDPASITLQFKSFLSAESGLRQPLGAPVPVSQSDPPRSGLRYTPQ